MSSRALKKLLKEDDLNVRQKGQTVEEKSNVSDDNSSCEETSTPQKKPLNRYDLLQLMNQQSPSESEVKEEEDTTETNVASTSITKQKKKKRKKKKSTKNSEKSSEDNDITEKKLLKDGGVLRPTNIATVVNDLFSIDLKHLNPHYEMRRTFGKRVVKMENKRGRPKPTLKTTNLVRTKDVWPNVPKDMISMEVVSPPILLMDGNSQNGISESPLVWYGFQHSKFYQSTQELFLSAVERTDSDFLVNLIKRCPYHINSLIQLSELCKMTENQPLAAELIERAVLIMELALHPSFSLTSGLSRLDYRIEENRGFYIALFKHAMYLEERACCRTAFELSKLIFNLNFEEDPLAMVLIIDYYAIRSKQFSWVVKYFEKWNSKKNLDQLPNMAFSYALALFYLNENEKADEALLYALLMFPATVKPLLAELSVQPDPRILSHKYFKTDISGSLPPALHQLIALYICRAKVIWRDPKIISWLGKNLEVVLDRINQSNVTAEFKEQRSRRYGRPPRAILRHIILSDYKEKVPLAEFIAKEKGSVVMYDPLPPLDTKNFYEKRPSNPPTPSGSSFSTFYDSVLNFTLGEDEQRMQIANTVENADREVNIHLGGLNLDNGASGLDAGVQYRELRQSLSTIVDAMRDFFSSMRIAEHSQNADGEGNGSTDFSDDEVI